MCQRKLSNPLCLTMSTMHLSSFSQLLVRSTTIDAHAPYHILNLRGEHCRKLVEKYPHAWNLISKAERLHMGRQSPEQQPFPEQASWDGELRGQCCWVHRRLQRCEEILNPVKSVERYFSASPTPIDTRLNAPVWCTSLRRSFRACYLMLWSFIAPRCLVQFAGNFAGHAYMLYKLYNHALDGLLLSELAFWLVK